MEEPQLTPEEIEVYQEMQEDAAEDAAEDQIETQLDIQEELHGSQDMEEKQNQHSFLHTATFKDLNSLKTTFLSEEELGRSMFSVRFLLDMFSISNYYLDDLAKELGIENKIAQYFEEKVKNITDSGMSNKGFVMNLNVTKKMDIERKKMRINDSSIQNLQGGKKRRR
ncbi:hypothetical protein LCGC14_0538280 [marine sediment metagenome]|uniref:Uncharacterized protein n=1 Tax=marine sediment metagenome TaxID=412755 RepID=A0A0F9RTR3_9ZZZZ|nr:hypothetical protein [bacterium]